MPNLKDVKRTERGWGGHFCCSERCRFRRNTLLECEDVKIVVSSVGLYRLLPTDEKFSALNCSNSYFETKAFYVDPKDTRYHDADVTKQVFFESKWSIDRVNADDEANDMHETVVDEISHRLSTGEKFDAEE